jgi:photosystem II stability/assembly factor-like uncharacterized protein
MKCFFLSTLFVALGSPPETPRWERQAVSTDADFRGLSVVNSNVVWASGSKGTYARTADGGKNWSVATVPGAEKLDFRDVKAFGEQTAYLLSAGPGDASRIYKTSDGGNSWSLQFKNSDPAGFFDAMSFWDDKTGIALGDPVRGRYQLISTRDGGANWNPLPEKSQPEALPNEGAFAASGTCLVTYGDTDVWICTGGAKVARVLHSGDRGQSWTASDTPIMSGTESAGIFSIAFRDRNHGLAVGGDYRKPVETGVCAASTADGGKTWTVIDKPFPFRSCVARSKESWVVVGASGSDLSRDDGRTWSPVDRQGFNTVGFSSTGDGWAVGPKGRLARFVR